MSLAEAGTRGPISLPEYLRAAPPPKTYQNDFEKVYAKALQATGASPKPWTTKERSFAAHAFRHSGRTATDFCKVLRWVITNWERVIDNAFPYMKNPPRIPTIEFICSPRKFNKNPVFHTLMDISENKAITKQIDLLCREYDRRNDPMRFTKEELEMIRGLVQAGAKAPVAYVIMNNF